MVITTSNCTEEKWKITHLCDYHKLISQTNKDPFPLPFLDSVLDIMARHEMYSFMDGYNGYNQVKMAKEDKEKTSFIIEWGAYAYNVVPFGLCNTSANFQKVVTRNFKEYLNNFMGVFKDDCLWTKRRASESS
jgi:hypothetical protein